MKAGLQSRYGDPDVVLAVSDVPVPPIGDHDVLVHVRASSVHPDVWHVVTGKPYVLRLMGAGVGRPKQPVPGIDLAGVVEAVGRGVTRFRPGDNVFGESHAGIQWINGGAFAEYAAAPQGTLALEPDNVTFELSSVPRALAHLVRGLCARPSRERPPMPGKQEVMMTLADLMRT